MTKLVCVRCGEIVTHCRTCHDYFEEGDTAVCDSTSPPHHFCDVECACDYYGISESEVKIEEAKP